MPPRKAPPSIHKTSVGQSSPPESRITLRDIAVAMDVTAMTVSRALRNQPQISEAMRRRIQEKALEMGYRPDAMLSALAHYRHSRAQKPVTAALAWINAWPKAAQLQGFHEFHLYWQGAAQAAEKLGFRLEEFVVNLEMPLSRLEKVLHARNIRGIIIPPHARITVDWPSFDWSQFNVVCMGRNPAMPPVHCVTSAQAWNAMLAFDKIREKGYQRIGFVGELHRARMFGAGFHWVQNELPEELQIPPLLYDDGDLAGNQRKLVAWLKKNQPDAIFTEKAALPQMLAQAGCRVPEDIGLAATNVLDMSIDAGITSNAKEIGRVAALVAISLIQDNARGLPPIIREILIRGAWVDGKSLPGKG